MVRNSFTYIIFLNMITHLNKNSLASEAANKDPQTATTTFSPDDLFLLNALTCGEISVRVSYTCSVRKKLLRCRCTYFACSMLHINRSEIVPFTTRSIGCDAVQSGTLVCNEWLLLLSTALTRSVSESDLK